jgi:Asp-tRNA(Asn)/Glu-tRNA(Gln) amidotransferase A subunit family amidase
LSLQKVFISLFLGFIVVASLFTVNIASDPGDTESFSIRLAWDPSEGTALAGYKVYWGHSSRNYIYSLDVGMDTSAMIAGLTRSNDYFFAVVSYNDSGFESDYSNEVFLLAGSPTAVDGDSWQSYR